jgi:hypothetical protein
MLGGASMRRPEGADTGDLLEPIWLWPLSPGDELL